MANPNSTPVSPQPAPSDHLTKGPWPVAPCPAWPIVSGTRAGMDGATVPQTTPTAPECGLFLAALLFAREEEGISSTIVMLLGF